MKKCFILILFLICFSAFAQIKGVVIDSVGTPIPYVNIWVEGKNIGTTSQEDGSFIINILAEKMLVFSAVGFETSKINSLDAKKVILKAKVNRLNEVNVVKRKVI